MKLHSLSAVFLLASAVSVVTASNSPYYKYGRNAAGELISKTDAENDAKATDGLPNFMSASTPFVYGSKTPFRNWNGASEHIKVFRNLGKENYHPLLRFATQSPGRGVPSTALLKGQKFGDFVRHMKGADIKACHSNACQKFIAEAFINQGSVNKELWKSLNGSQISHIIAKLIEKADDAAGTGSAADLKSKGKAKEGVFKALTNLPVGHLKSYAKLIVANIGKNLPYLPVEVIKEVMTPEGCSVVKHKHISHLLCDANRAKLLTSGCLAKVAGLKHMVIDSGTCKLTGLNHNALEAYNDGLEGSVLKAIPKGVVTGFASAFTSESDRPGKELDIASIDAKAIAGLTQPILLGRLNSLDKTIEPLLTLTEPAGKVIPKDIFKTLTVPENAYTALTKIAPDTYPFLPKPALQDIVDSYPELCGNLPDNSQKLFINININKPRCFQNMSSLNQALALATANSLHDDCLCHVTFEQLEAWYFKKSGDKGEEMRGAAVLGAKSHKNAERLVAGLGADPNGKNPCFHFTPLSMFIENKVLANNISAKCFQALPRNFDDLDEETRKKLPAHLKLLAMSWNHLKKQTDNFYTEMKPETLRTLVRGGAFCHAVDTATLGKLPIGIMSEITSRCYMQFASATRDALTGAQVAALSSDLFATVPATQVPTALIKHMTKAQIASACSKSTDTANNNLGVNFTADTVGAFSAEQISGVTLDQWSKTPAEAFAGVGTQEKLKAVSPEAMAYWTVSQTKNVPEAVIVNISVDQAKEIGSKAVVTEQPTAYLANLLAISPEVLEALNARLPEDQRVSTGLQWWIWLLIVVGVLVVIGGGVGAYYYFSS